MPTPSSRISLKDHLQPLAAGILCLVIYLPSWLWMWERWWARDSYYSHGLLVPFITGFLIWQRREELAKIKVERSGWGMPLIVLGLLVYFGSALFRIYFSSAFSMIAVLCGMILHFYGARILRMVLFPVLFLFFMMPLPLVAIINISFKMKMFAATIAAGVLNSMGLEAVQQGSIIKMKHAYVVVDDVCSGLRSLISLTALGSIFAYWMQGPMWKRVLLFLTTIPIAIVTNVCRVVLLSCVSEIWGPERASGFIHDASGFLVFALAFIMLYACGKLIE